MVTPAHSPSPSPLPEDALLISQEPVISLVDPSPSNGPPSHHVIPSAPSGPSIPTATEVLAQAIPDFIATPTWTQPSADQLKQLTVSLEDLLGNSLTEVLTLSNGSGLDPQTVMDAKDRAEKITEGVEDLAFGLGFQWNVWYQAPLGVLDEDGREFIIPKGHYFTDRSDKGLTTGNPFLSPFTKNKLDNLKLYYQEMMVTTPNQPKFLDKVQALKDWRDPKLLRHSWKH